MAVGTLSNVFPGGERPSGLPVDITQQLVDAKRQQALQPLEQDQKELQSQTKLMQQVNGLTQAVGQAAGQLDEPGDLKAFTASSSDSDAVSATVTGSPAPGNYNVDLSGSGAQLAQATNLLVGVDSDGTAESTQDTVASGEGVSDPNDSAVINAGVDLAFDHQGTQHTYTTDSDTTLTSLADTIDSDANGVSASAKNIGTNDSPAYVLNLQSERTGGGENKITQPGSATQDGITTNGGSLFRDTADDSDEVEQAANGQNAVFDVDGVTYERSTNEVSDAIEGVELNLQRAGSQVNIGVSRNTEQVTQGMQALVNAVNKTNAFIDQQTQYNGETGEAGPLLGNSTVRQVDSTLRGAIGQGVAGTEDQDLQYLTQVGLSFDREGQLNFDAAEFEQALGNRPQEVENLLTGDGGAMTRLTEQVNGLTNSVDGTISTALDRLESRDSRLQGQIQEAQSQVLAYDQRISDRYAQLEQTVVELQKVEDNISQIVGGSS